jgi:hypothetical protein
MVLDLTRTSARETTMRTRAMPLLMLLLAACVSRGAELDPVPEPAVQTPAVQTPPAQTSAFDPVGTYEFNAEMMGQTQTGVLLITRTNGQLTGTITVREEALPLRDLKLVEARKLTAIGVPPQNESIQVNFTFTFEDNDKFTGTLAIPQMGEARLWGTRKKTD